MRRGNWELLWLRDFSGGLVSQPEPHDLVQGQWHDLQNVRLDKSGGFKKRGGSTVKNTTIALRYD